MGKAVVALALLLLAAASGCLWGQPEEKDYFPVEKAQDLSYTHTTAITTAQGTQEDSLKLEIAPGAYKNVGGEECLEFSFVFGGEESHSECYYRKGNAVYLAARFFEGEEVEITPPMPLLQEPFEEGSWWDWQGTEGSIESEAEFEIQGIESISAGGKEYEALAVLASTKRSDGAKIVSTRWYADGVGMVKDSTEITNSNFPGTEMEIEVEVE